jgi:hypothetical protein
LLVENLLEFDFFDFQIHWLIEIYAFITQNIHFRKVSKMPMYNNMCTDKCRELVVRVLELLGRIAILAHKLDWIPYV